MIILGRDAWKKLYKFGQIKTDSLLRLGINLSRPPESWAFSKHSSPLPMLLAELGSIFSLFEFLSTLVEELRKEKDACLCSLLHGLAYTQREPSSVTNSKPKMLHVKQDDDDEQIEATWKDHQLYIVLYFDL